MSGSSGGTAVPAPGREATSRPARPAMGQQLQMSSLLDVEDGLRQAAPPEGCTNLQVAGI